MSWQPKKATVTTTGIKDAQSDDICIPSPPGDGISSISVNANSTMLIATAWDNTVNCYEIQSSGGKISNVIPQAQIRHEAPVLCSDISTVSN